MNIYEIEWCANHKYGENVYLIKADKEILILTATDKWRILLDDLTKFGCHTLFHANAQRGYYYQCDNYSLEWLVYYVIRHDLGITANFREFQRLYEMYCLGCEIEENVARFNFFCD